MTLTVLQALTVLEHIAEAAQTTGLVPGGTPALTLALLTAGLKTTLASGVFTQHTSVEISRIGDDYDAAVAHMRAVLTQSPPPAGA